MIIVAGALICLPAFYVASFGPICWCVARFDSWENRDRTMTVTKAYRPIVILLLNAPSAVKGTAEWYLRLGAPAGVGPTVRGQAFEWQGHNYSLARLWIQDGRTLMAD